MRAIIGMAALAVVSGVSLAADQQVGGYIRQDGTYVQPHHRTAPNDTRTDNYGSRPNVNPYNGQQGTGNPYAPPPQPNYGQPSRPRY